jgi:hypothetical protein
VPGFYDQVRTLTPADRERFARTPFDEQAFLAEAGAPEPTGEKGYTTLERTTARPTIDVNGMWSGYIGEGEKTVLPSFAAAKVSMRLVPDQDPAELFPRVAAFVKKLAPPGVTVELRDLHSAPPFITSPDHPSLTAARRALGRAWTKPAVMIRGGGSIPVMATFQQTHDLPCILMGFGLHDDQVHAPNEKFSLSSFHGGSSSMHHTDLWIAVYRSGRAVRMYARCSNAVMTRNASCRSCPEPTRRRNLPNVSQSAIGATATQLSRCNSSSSSDGSASPATAWARLPVENATERSSASISPSSSPTVTFEPYAVSAEASRMSCTGIPSAVNRRSPSGHGSRRRRRPRPRRAPR